MDTNMTNLGFLDFFISGVNKWVFYELLYSSWMPKYKIVPILIKIATYMTWHDYLFTPLMTHIYYISNVEEIKSKRKVWV